MYFGKRRVYINKFNKLTCYGKISRQVTCQSDDYVVLCFLLSQSGTCGVLCRWYARVTTSSSSVSFVALTRQSSSMVEQALCKRQVVSSILTSGSSKLAIIPLSKCVRAEIPKWSNGADCKSAGVSLRGSESLSRHQKKEMQILGPLSSDGRATPW